MRKVSFVKNRSDYINSNCLKRRRPFESCQTCHKFQQACQFHEVATSLLKPSLLQLVILRFSVTVEKFQ